MGLFYISEARCWQSTSVLDLSWHYCAFTGWYSRSTFQVPLIQAARAHFGWEPMRASRIIPTLCGYTGVYYIVECVSNVALMCWSLGMEPRSGHVFAARTQRWNYTQAGLSNTTHVFKDLKRNAIRREPGYTKHRRVSSTTYEDRRYSSCVLFRSVVVSCWSRKGMQSRLRVTKQLRAYPAPLLSHNCVLRSWCIVLYSLRCSCCCCRVWDFT